MMISWWFAGRCTVQIASSAPVVDCKTRLAVAIAVGLCGRLQGEELTCPKETRKPAKTQTQSLNSFRIQTNQTDFMRCDATPSNKLQSFS